MELPNEVTEQLGYYVYLYIDPIKNMPFYIGKGTGTRVLSHLSDTSETKKVATIRELRANGLKPRIEILRYGLTEKEAALVEASVIDLIGIEQLTNKIRGHHSRSYGRVSLNELITTFSAKPVEITHRVILITINKRYRSNMSPIELIEATRGIWKVGPKRDRAEYAFAVYRGVVREVFHIHKWYPAGTLQYETRDSSRFRDSGRWEFDGEVAYDIRGIYIDTSVRNVLGKSNQNPIRYVNI